MNSSVPARQGRSRRGAGAFFIGVCVGAVASLSLFAAAPEKGPDHKSGGEARTATPDAQPRAAAPMAREEFPLAAQVDWSQVQAVRDPGPMAIGEEK
jgi:hypothetical protein